MFNVAITTLAACLITFTGSAQAIGLYCLNLETVPAEFRGEPTVHYEVHTISSALLNTKYCPDPAAGEVVGCTYWLDNGARWVIVIADTVSDEDYPCVLAYEKAHLPPNCWGDPRVESGDALTTFAALCP